MKRYKYIKIILSVTAMFFAVLAGEQSGYARKFINAYDKSLLITESEKVNINITQKDIISIRQSWNGNLPIYMLLSFVCLAGLIFLERKIAVGLKSDM